MRHFIPIITVRLCVTLTWCVVILPYCFAVQKQPLSLVSSAMTTIVPVTLTCSTNELALRDFIRMNYFLCLCRVAEKAIVYWTKR